MSSVMNKMVGPEDDGQRLDRWLKKCVPELPYGLAQKLIRKGAIRVDGKRAKTDTRLSAGQEVRIPPIEDRPDRERAYRAAVTAQDEAYLRSLVIYDDGDVIALNKPGDIATQGGGGVERHIDGLLDALKGKDEMRPRLVHRLDRDTSGVLLLARSPEAVRALGKIFMGRQIRKIYWAITVPAPEQNEGTIRASLAKASGPIKDRMVIEDSKEAKSAVTDFIVLERAGKRAAFVAFWPRTGRTHQIRVHAADALHCPILGDAKYGGEEAWLDGMDLDRRLHLHARRVILPHPLQAKKTLDITAPLPDDLRRSWQAFGFECDGKDDPFAG